MKIPSIFVATVLFSCTAHGQIMGKFYYNKHWELTTKDSTVYVRMCIYDTLNNSFAGVVKDMYPNGKPQMTGTYKHGLKEGDFTFYYDNGVVESTGKFINGNRIGPWNFYHPNGQSKAAVIFLSHNVFKVTSVTDENGGVLVKDGNGQWYEEYQGYRMTGKIILSGEVRNHKKHGEWTCKLSTGELIYTEEYKNGDLVRGYEYPNGVKTKRDSRQDNQLMLPYKFVVTEANNAANGVDFKTYPFLDAIRRNGESFYNAKGIAYTDTLAGMTVPDRRTPGKQPEDKELGALPVEGYSDMYQFLSDEAQYPPGPRRSGVQGKVFISFHVEPDGALTRFSIAKGVHPELDKETLRIFRKYAVSHKWNPAQKLGKPVRVRMVVPFTYKLG